MTHDERVNKLPRWAQQHITRLERNVQSLEARLHLISTQEPTNIRARTRVLEWETYLPNDSDVSFAVNPNGIQGYDREIMVSIDEENQKLSIRTESGQLLIKPMSSNYIQAWPDPYRRPVRNIRYDE